MSDDHKMLLLLEDIVRTGHELHVAIRFHTDDICVIHGAEINILDGMTDPFRQRRNFIDGVAIPKLHVIKDLIGGETYGDFFSDIAVGVNDLIGAVF